MARPLRVSFPGACYHIMARGNARSLMFLDAEDYRKFLEILTEVAARFSIVIYAYCIMPNHYHLVCRTRDANVSLAVAFLNGVYAQWWNHRHGRCGHLTQGRFKAQLVQNDLYLRVVGRYVMNNPVRAGLVQHPHDWEWSSARASAGEAEPPAFLDTSLGGLLMADRDAVPPVSEGVANPGDLPAQPDVARAIREDDRFLGDGTDLSTLQHLVGLARAAGIPRRDWVGIRPTLAELFACTANAGVRDRQIAAAREDWGFTRQEIAEFLDVHVETVTRTIRKQRRRTAASAPGV
jgi:putative transposase